jgi:hypothetical protein
VLYAYVEGCGTKRDYLRGINEQYGPELGFYIDVTVNNDSGLTPRGALEKAQARRRELLRESGRSKLQKAPEIWILVDRDDNTPEELRKVREEAESQGIKFALSDPCFELWLLLHFTGSPGPQGGAREPIYRRLRRVHPAFEDYGTRGGNKRLPEPRLAPLRGHEGEAASRAARLTRDCASGACVHVGSGICGPGDQDPSTGVHELISRLGLGRPDA